MYQNSLIYVINSSVSECQKLTIFEIRLIRSRFKDDLLIMTSLILFIYLFLAKLYEIQFIYANLKQMQNEKVSPLCQVYILPNLYKCYVILNNNDVRTLLVHLTRKTMVFFNSSSYTESSLKTINARIKNKLFFKRRFWDCFQNIW